MSEVKVTEERGYTRFKNMRNGRLVTLESIRDSFVYVKYDDSSDTVQYRLAYFDRVFNPIEGENAI